MINGQYYFSIQWTLLLYVQQKLLQYLIVMMNLKI